MKRIALLFIAFITVEFSYKAIETTIHENIILGIVYAMIAACSGIYGWELFKQSDDNDLDKF